MEKTEEPEFCFDCEEPQGIALFSLAKSGYTPPNRFGDFLVPDRLTIHAFQESMEIYG